MASNPDSPLWLPAAMLAAFITGAGLAAIALPPDVAAAVAVAVPAGEAGKVLKVVDGDTFEFEAIDGRKMTVHLAQIDAPPLTERGGAQARDNLARLLGSDPLSVRIGGMDRFGLTQATVFAGPTNLGAEQVRTGNARVLRKYLSDPRLLVLEQAARNARVGVWSPAMVKAAKTTSVRGGLTAAG